MTGNRLLYFLHASYYFVTLCLWHFTSFPEDVNNFIQFIWSLIIIKWLPCSAPITPFTLNMGIFYPVSIPVLKIESPWSDATQLSLSAQICLHDYTIIYGKQRRLLWYETGVVELSNFITCPWTSKWSKSICPTKSYLPKNRYFSDFSKKIYVVGTH